MNVVDSKGRDRTFRNNNLVLDIDIARNKINTEEQYNRMSEEQKQNLDTVIEPIIKAKIKESKNYMPKTSELLDGIIVKLYSKEVEGVLSAIENNKQVSKEKLIKCRS